MYKFFRYLLGIIALVLVCTQMGNAETFLNARTGKSVKVPENLSIRQTQPLQFYDIINETLRNGYSGTIAIRRAIRFDLVQFEKYYVETIRQSNDEFRIEQDWTPYKIDDHDAWSMVTEEMRDLGQHSAPQMIEFRILPAKDFYCSVRFVRDEPNIIKGRVMENNDEISAFADNILKSCITDQQMKSLPVTGSWTNSLTGKSLDIPAIWEGVEGSASETGSNQDTKPLTVFFNDGDENRVSLFMVAKDSSFREGVMEMRTRMMENAIRDKQMVNGKEIAIMKGCMEKTMLCLEAWSYEGPQYFTIVEASLQKGKTISDATKAFMTALFGTID